MNSMSIAMGPPPLSPRVMSLCEEGCCEGSRTVGSGAARRAPPLTALCRRRRCSRGERAAATGVLALTAPVRRAVGGGDVGGAQADLEGEAA